MPQIATHIIIAEKVKAALGNPQDIANNNEAYNLGAVGPDLTLMLFDSEVGENPALNTAIDTLHTIVRFVETLNEIVAQVGGPIHDFADWVTGGLSTDFTNLVGLGVQSLQQLMLMQTIPGSTASVANPFHNLNIPGVPNGPVIEIRATRNDALLPTFLRKFGHPYTNDPGFKDPNSFSNHDEWWWMDILHYRRTGRFAEKLLDRANRSGNDILKAYSKGYWTHVGGDVVGHPYVNAVVGGPFRNHALRHMVVENVIDSWVWNHYKNQDITSSELHKLISVNDDFEVIANHLVNTMKAVYTGDMEKFPPTDPEGGLSPIRPSLFTNSVPGIDDLERAYQTLLLFTQLSTSTGIAAPVPPPGSPQEFFEEVGSSILSTVGNIPQAFAGASSIWEILLGIFVAALYGLVLLFKLITLPAAVLLRAATLTPRWLAYWMQVALYNYVQNTRWMLALSGLGKVSRDDLMFPLATTFYRLPPDRTGNNAFNYPYNMVSRIPQAFWLEDPMFAQRYIINGKTKPGPKLERANGAESCPYPTASTPDIFIDGPAYDQRVHDTLTGFYLPAQGIGGPAETVSIERATIGGSQLGNAVDFSLRLIDGRYRRLLIRRGTMETISFDLDGDQGYGFVSWAGEEPRYSRELI